MDIQFVIDTVPRSPDGFSGTISLSTYPRIQVWSDPCAFDNKGLAKKAALDHLTIRMKETLS